MSSSLEKASADRLVDVARETSQGMRAVAAGKPGDHATHSDARSFIGIAGLLDMLIGEIERLDALATRRRDALARIADLKIRGGVQLIENNDWRRITSELREIAGETLTAEAPDGAAGHSSPERRQPLA